MILWTTLAMYGGTRETEPMATTRQAKPLRESRVSK